MKELKTDKAQALEAYKTAKQNYFNLPNDENWKIFCDAKILCRLLGIII